MRNRGIVVGVIAAFVALASLTGCSSLAAATPWTETAGETIATQAFENPSEPTVGSCWQLEYPDVVAEPAYPVGAKVSCSSPHQSYTYAVISLVSNDGSAVSPSDLGQEQLGAQYACTDRFRELFPALVANRENRILWGTFVSAVALEAKGNHWARCDLQELKVGSPFLDPTLANLPNYTSWSADITANPAKYALCLNSPGSNGSTGPNIDRSATVADCRTAQWTLKSATDQFPDPPGTPYPDYSGLYPFMHAHCGALYDSATIRGWDFYPLKTQWDSGDRTFSCWIGKR